MENLIKSANVQYVDVRGNKEDVARNLCNPANIEYEEHIITSASPEKTAAKLRELTEENYDEYKIAEFADSFNGDDLFLILENLKYALRDLDIEITQPDPDKYKATLPNGDEVYFDNNGQITASKLKSTVGKNILQYIMCFVDQDFASVIEKDGKFIYVCDISSFEKTPKDDNGENRMLGKDFLEFHSHAPNFGHQLSKVLPKMLQSFANRDTDMFIVDLSGLKEYRIGDGKSVKRFERDKFLPLFDKEGRLKGFVGFADVYFQDSSANTDPLEGGDYHDEIKHQADLIRSKLDLDTIPLATSDIEKKLEYVRMLLSRKHEDAVHDRILIQAEKLNQKQFGRKIELYGISYISDECENGCDYCGHNCNIDRDRTTLTDAEMIRDFGAALKHRPDEFCILSGETEEMATLCAKALENLKTVLDGHNNPLKKITFNVAPMSVRDFRRIVETNKTGLPLQYRIFQESYNIETYRKHHKTGPKSDFNFRREAQARALKGGFDSVGLGVLLGLNPSGEAGNDMEIQELIRHASELGDKVESVSLPRLQAINEFDNQSIVRVDNRTYSFYIAIIRLALPHVKLMITSRENMEFMQELEPLINIRDLAPRPGVGGNFRKTDFRRQKVGFANY